jgi:hypothetical protein
VTESLKRERKRCIEIIGRLRCCPHENNVETNSVQVEMILSRCSEQMDKDYYFQLSMKAYQICYNQLQERAAPESRDGGSATTRE